MSRRTPLTPQDPSKVGPYRLIERLGVGGMGVVYLATGPTGDQVALKVMREDLATQASFRTRFAREIGAARAVYGAFTARLIDADTESSPQWIATEYVPGPTLAEYIDAHGPLPEEQARLLGLGLAEAIEAVHAAGLIHRDLKPSNIILSADGPKVIDFGISHAADATSITQTGVYVGSLAWMSPEQITGAELGSASDVFAWGLVVAYAALGHHPYGEGRPEAIAFRILNQQPDLTRLSPQLRRAVGVALSTDPQQRVTPSHLLSGLSDPVEVHDVTAAMTQSWDATLAGVHRPSITVAEPSPQRQGSEARPALRQWQRGALAALGAAAVAGVIGAGALALDAGRPVVAGDAGPVEQGRTPVGSAATVAVPRWQQDVDASNGWDFNDWLLDHEGQIVQIDAHVEGEWTDLMHGAPVLAVNQSEWGTWDTALQILPRTSGQSGYDGGAVYADLRGYYAINPSDHINTVGYLQTLQALDTVEALELLGTSGQSPASTPQAVMADLQEENPNEVFSSIMGEGDAPWMISINGPDVTQWNWDKESRSWRQRSIWRGRIASAMSPRQDGAVYTSIEQVDVTGDGLDDFVITAQGEQDGHSYESGSVLVNVAGEPVWADFLALDGEIYGAGTWMEAQGSRLVSDHGAHGWRSPGGHLVTIWDYAGFKDGYPRFDERPGSS